MFDLCIEQHTRDLISIAKFYYGKQCYICQNDKVSIIACHGFTCTVVEPDRSCVVSVTSSPLHIAAAAAAGVDSWSTQSNIGCGTKTQPWMLEAPAGQRINISLLDFTAVARLTSQHLTRSTSHIITSSSSSSSSSGSCVDENHQYGYIIDESPVNKKNVSVCHARSNRQTHVYLSTSNVLQLVLTTNRNFLVKIEGPIIFVLDNV